jgi:hypothetical protein
MLHGRLRPSSASSSITCKLLRARRGFGVSGLLLAPGCSQSGAAGPDEAAWRKTRCAGLVGGASSGHDEDRSSDRRGVRRRNSLSAKKWNRVCGFAQRVGGRAPPLPDWPPNRRCRTASSLAFSSLSRTTSRWRSSSKARCWRTCSRSHSSISSSRAGVAAAALPLVARPIMGAARWEEKGREGVGKGRKIYKITESTRAGNPTQCAARNVNRRRCWQAHAVAAPTRLPEAHS